MGTSSNKPPHPLVAKPLSVRSKMWGRHDPYDPHLLLKTNYVELDEKDLPQQGVQTTIKGGSQNMWRDTSRGDERSRPSIENAQV